MRTTATQLAAFDALDPETRRTQKQMIVDLFTAPDTRLTRQDIADRTNMRLSSVCGRVRALIDAGKLAVFGTRKCDATGHENETLGLPAAN
ncbi:hypothetical protein M3I53_01200 [Paraburkholderia sp. CNPSo 3272]|uniref:hypothetical protein n=1 Tax=Paraburkholderia sp. CNPSo 3272 TaxID=2940931 RepID=UPI0020B74E42|nr:hypothetical protein [Paraburkholderia sp. CNPSo 3272]MCP3721753.1 hypothetical protein [Paraburkholderia sp. CNPSo 3272]